MKYLWKSILAGVSISLGAWLYLSIENQVIGALCFSCGLLCVRLYNLNLYTGKVQFIVTKKYKWYHYLIFLYGNFCGAIVMSWIARVALPESAQLIGQAKYAQSIWLALFKGIGCGCLMSIATYQESPLWVSSLCVIAFILAGFNHSIADIFYLSISHHILGWSWLGTLIGNTIGGIFTSYFITTKGRTE